MALFLSGNIHQGNERFSVHSRGKQCVFITLSAILINSTKHAIEMLDAYT